MRGKKAALNTVFNLLQELVSVVCSLILPRLILSAFGSKYNGLTTSITQFLACAVLLRSGLGGATRAALYKPLADHDKRQISAIVNATGRYMRRIGLILSATILVFAAIYPAFVRGEFDWLFTFTLVLIIGAGTFAESFFGITYVIVLQADQQLWISSLITMLCTIMNTIIASILILCGASIHIVKLGSALVFVLHPIVLAMYVNKKYQIDKTVPPNNLAISQRWDAFWHQFSFFVMNNTDIMVLTAFSNLLEVSVYSVYNTVLRGLRRVITSFSTSQEAAYGNMIAKGQYDLLRENISVMEMVMYGISTVIYTCAGVLILDFVGIYTKGITDVNYIRPAFAYIMLLANFFSGIRVPYQMVVQAAGHYRQTKAVIMVEPVLNIVLSIILVFKYGLIGVAIGTLVATVYKTILFAYYMRKHIVKRSWLVTICKCLASFGEIALILLIMHNLPIPQPINYLSWIQKAIITGVISMVIVIGGNYLLFRQDFYMVLRRIVNVFRPSKRRSV